METGLAGFFAALLIASVTAVPISYTSDGHLQVIEAGDNVLEAIFYTSEMGIRIRGESTSLIITSMSTNEVLMGGSKPHGSSKLVSVMGSSFLEYESTSETGQRQKVEFIVPESLVEEAKEAIESRKEERIISQLNGIDETETQTARERAFERLFARPELTLLKNASFALGRAGILGYENQGALNFYAVVIAMLKHQNDGMDGEEGSGDIPQPNENSASRFKRLVYCYNSREYCWKCPIGEYCVGKCGIGCNWCWSWFCYPCCFRWGCYYHDICCGGQYGYFSPSCFLPIGFACDSYTC